MLSYTKRVVPRRKGRWKGARRDVDSGPLPGRFGNCGFQETKHGLFQLRIHFISDGHDVEQNGTEIDAAQIVLQGIENTDLQNSRFFHDHGDGVTLPPAENSMITGSPGNGRLGIDWKAQATNKIAQEEREMPGSILVREGNCRELVGAFDAAHPILNGLLQVTFENCGNALFADRRVGGRTREFFLDDRGDFAEGNRIQQDLVSLQENGGHSRLQHGVVAEHQSYSLWLRVAHGVDYGETITGIRHIQIGEQDVEGFRSNKPQGLADGAGRRDRKPLAFQAFLKRNANVVFVFRQQDFGFFHHSLDLSDDVALEIWAVKTGTEMKRGSNRRMTRAPAIEDV